MHVLRCASDTRAGAWSTQQAARGLAACLPLWLCAMRQSGLQPLLLLAVLRMRARLALVAV